LKVYVVPDPVGVLTVALVAVRSAAVKLAALIASLNVIVTGIGERLVELVVVLDNVTVGARESYVMVSVFEARLLLPPPAVATFAGIDIVTTPFATGVTLNDQFRAEPANPLTVPLTTVMSEAVKLPPVMVAENVTVTGIGDTLVGLVAVVANIVENAANACGLSPSTAKNRRITTCLDNPFPSATLPPCRPNDWIRIPSPASC
jgi:hypothetical protein